MKIKKKKGELKSFFFDDGAESNISFNKKNNNEVRISSNKTAFLFFCFLGLIFIFSVKIIYLSLFPEKNILSKKINVNSIANRSDIIDRNGVILARNINIYSAGVRPRLIKNKKNFLINLRIIFPNLNYSEISKKLKNDKFFYIKKRLTEDEKTNLWLIGNKAIIFEKKQFRIYPQKNLFSHVIGQIDDNNTGISGIEKYFDNKLKKRKSKNQPLNLTLDSNLQYIIRNELINAQFHFKNIGAAAILMNVENGEVLSLVSLPDYDLNKRTLINNDIFLNKITLGVYELGSVFKTFTIAAGLENEVIKPNTVFKKLKNKLTCDKYTITEHDKLPDNLSAEQILVRSSNIGAVRIAQKIGIEKYRSFLNNLDLLNKVNFDLEEIGTPLDFKWGKCKLATSSYGHGITTTPLQLARAYAILGNGGYKIYPYILKKDKKLFKKNQQIISKETSDIINSMLRKVVSLEEGTANFADIKGYEVGGKTGTAVKYNSEAKLNTFVSIFPTSRPKYVLLVMLDEPKPAPHFVYEFPPSKKFPKGYKYKGEKRNTSGWNTVVVAGKIIEKIGPILAINNLQASNNF
jgi:cell division protein FtsI (penicillin-binding protein 3)